VAGIVQFIVALTGHFDTTGNVVESPPMHFVRPQLHRRGQQGFARAEALLTALGGLFVALLSTVLFYINGKVDENNRAYQNDYRDLRKQVESTDKEIRKAFYDATTQQVQVNASLNAKLEALGDAVSKKKRN
jgi:hypothetical protein